MALAVVPGAGPTDAVARVSDARCSRRPTSRTSSTRGAVRRATAPSLSSGSSRTTRRSRTRSSPSSRRATRSTPTTSPRCRARPTTRRRRRRRVARGGGGGAGAGQVSADATVAASKEEGAERDAARAGAADAHGAEAAGRAAARPRRDPAHRAVRRAQRPHLPHGDREPRGAQPPVRLPQADAPPLLVLHVARRRLLEVSDAARGAARPPRARRGGAVAHARADPARRGYAAARRADLEGRRDMGPRAAPHDWHDFVVVETIGAPRAISGAIRPAPAQFARIFATFDSPPPAVSEGFDDDDEVEAGPCVARRRDAAADTAAEAATAPPRRSTMAPTPTPTPAGVPTVGAEDYVSKIARAQQGGDGDVRPGRDGGCASRATGRPRQRHVPHPPHLLTPHIFPHPQVRLEGGGHAHLAPRPEGKEQKKLEEGDARTPTSPVPPPRRPPPRRPPRRRRPPRAAPAPSTLPLRPPPSAPRRRGDQPHSRAAARVPTSSATEVAIGETVGGAKEAEERRRVIHGTRHRSRTANLALQTGAARAEDERNQAARCPAPAGGAAVARARRRRRLAWVRRGRRAAAAARHGRQRRLRRRPACRRRPGWGGPAPPPPAWGRRAAAAAAAAARYGPATRRRRRRRRSRRRARAPAKKAKGAEAHGSNQIVSLRRRSVDRTLFQSFIRISLAPHRLCLSRSSHSSRARTNHYAQRCRVCRGWVGRVRACALGFVLHPGRGGHEGQLGVGYRTSRRSDAQ